ncbi:MAG: tellurite-resistance/dicarboxylate transporter [Thermoplasmata archaeon]
MGPITSDSRLDFIRNFSPSWFASVMGTGILAVTTLYYSPYLPALRDVAIFFFYLNLALFSILLIPWVLRWVMFRQNALFDLNHPITSSFYATIAIALLVLAVDFIVIGKNTVAGEVFWLFGVILTVFFATLIPFIMFKSEGIKVEHVNPGWFIPPVGLIVIPIAGSLIIDKFTGLTQEVIIFINYFGWGAGFFLYLALLAICFYRFILHTPLPGTLTPTLWINLGPIGAGIVALVNIVKESPFITVKEPLFVFAFLFWGFGIWWVIMAMVMLLHYLRRMNLPFALSWWAFTFPLGAYIAATHAIASIFNLVLVNYIGFALYWLLVIFWAVTLVRTVVHSYRGTIFRSQS